MKKISWLLCSYILLTMGCKKEEASLSPDAQEFAGESYVQYIIHKGQQYCDENYFKAVAYSELKFKVKFDSSAIYTTSEPGNQYDINKLYGFSDNNSDHHQFSARFGWRWSDGALRLFGYVYNEGVRRSKELGAVSIGSENDCSIKVGEGAYTFTLNDKADTILRKSTTLQAVGYKLYPYFGGDETAPHDIKIWIKEMP